MQVIPWHAGFMKAAEGFYEALASSSHGIKLGLAFAEANGLQLIRSEGNGDALKPPAESNIMSLGIADGMSYSDAEAKSDIEKRRRLLRGSGYKK